MTQINDPEQVAKNIHPVIAPGLTHRIVTKFSFERLTTADGEVAFAKSSHGGFISEPVTREHAEDVATLDGFEAVAIKAEAKAAPQATPQATPQDAPFVRKGIAGGK